MKKNEKDKHICILAPLEFTNEYFIYIFINPNPKKIQKQKVSPQFFSPLDRAMLAVPSCFKLTAMALYIVKIVVSSFLCQVAGVPGSYNHVISTLCVASSYVFCIKSKWIE